MLIPFTLGTPPYRNSLMIPDMFCYRPLLHDERLSTNIVVTEHENSEKRLSSRTNKRLTPNRSSSAYLNKKSRAREQAGRISVEPGKRIGGFMAGAEMTEKGKDGSVNSSKILEKVRTTFVKFHVSNVWQRSALPRRKQRPTSSCC